jgi:hypothetical protein
VIAIPINGINNKKVDRKFFLTYSKIVKRLNFIIV